VRIPLASLPLEEPRCFRFDSTVVLVCRTEHGVFALEDVCSHSEFPLSGGPVIGTKIVCPVHGAAFDLRTGEPLTNTRLNWIKAYPVTIEGEEAVLGLSEGD
jgi:3-phenylpropionate/trans-cinnamate dioxygenase ferredoxin component